MVDFSAKGYAFGRNDRTKGMCKLKRADVEEIEKRFRELYPDIKVVIGFDYIGPDDYFPMVNGRDALGLVPPWKTLDQKVELVRVLAAGSESKPVGG